MPKPNKIPKSNNGSIQSFESILLNNPNVNTHPNLADMLSNYTLAIADGYEPSEDVIDAMSVIRVFETR